MTFQDDLEELKRLIRKPLVTLKEVEAIARRLEDTHRKDKNSSIVKTLMNLCDKSLGEVNQASNQIQGIKRKWGFASSPDYVSESGNVSASFKDLSVFDVKEENKDKWRMMEWALPEKFSPRSKDGQYNFRKGRFWEEFLEHELGFKEWHLGGELWNKQDPRTEEQKSLDRKMLEVSNLERKTKYDGVKKQDELDPSLAKEVAEFKLRGSSERRQQAQIQAEDLAIESANQGKPCRINYYFFEKPSDAKVKSILKIYENACKQHSGSQIEVSFHFGKTDKQIWEESQKNPPNPKQSQRSTGASYAAPKKQAGAMYQQIRGMNDDVSQIASNLDIPDNIVSAVRNHVFMEEHDIAVGSGQVERSRFEPEPEIADLWISAVQGTLSGDEVETFQRILAHQYIEQAVMKLGLPFLSSHPEAWKKGYNKPTRKHYGAHDLAPLCDVMRAPFNHWKWLGLAATQLPTQDVELSKLETLANIIGTLIQS